MKKSIAKNAGVKIAEDYSTGILDKIDGLLIHPEKYPPCRNPQFNIRGYRCFTHKKAYTVIYKVEGTLVQILGFIHSRKHPDNQAKEFFGR